MRLNKLDNFKPKGFKGRLGFVLDSIVKEIRESIKDLITIRINLERNFFVSISVPEDW